MSAIKQKRADHKVSAFFVLRYFWYLGVFKITLPAKLASEEMLLEFLAQVRMLEQLFLALQNKESRSFLLLLPLNQVFLQSTSLLFWLWAALHTDSHFAASGRSIHFLERGKSLSAKKSLSAFSFLFFHFLLHQN